MNRVALFIPTLNGGGAERVTVTLANALVARGFSVDLVLATAKGPYLKDVSSAVRVVDLNSGRLIKALCPLAIYLRRERPAAMLSAMAHANVVALLARKLSRTLTRLVVCEHALISGEHAISKKFSSHFIYWLIPRIYPDADAICAVSRTAALDLTKFAKLQPQSVRTIYNPFDLKRLATLAEQPLEHAWFAQDQPPVILAIGRLNEAKDFHVLIRAFAQLRKQRQVRLAILGEGELRHSLEALINQLGLNSDQVQLPGFVSNPFAWLARAKLFVLSSRREALPSALIEAMACGVPVVSTNCLSGPDEILEGGHWGRLVPVGDIDALTKAMAVTLDSPPAVRPDVRRRAADFEQEHAVNEYLKVLGLPTRTYESTTCS